MAKQHERRRHVRVEHPGGEEEPIRFELFSNEKLEAHAESLASAQKKASTLKKGVKLIPRVVENSRVLFEVQKAVAQEVRQKHAITPAAEWLLDNYHVIDEQISDIYNDLPEKYYRQLPKLHEGPLTGYPRVYGLVWALIAHTDSHFSADSLKLFVHAYQKIDPLTLGELWAVPITLRVILVENLRRIAVRIMRSQTGRRLADGIVDHFEQLSAQNENTDLILPSVKIPPLGMGRAYVVQVLQRLHDPHPGAKLSLDFMNDWLGQHNATLDEIVHREHAEQIADNATVRNIITSMRAISIFEWPQFVEDVSLVDKCLREHEGYGKMDYLSRDRYRHAIEDLAKYSPCSELDIACGILEKVKQSMPGSRAGDPGFYLIAEGRYAYEKEIEYQPALYQMLLRSYIKHSGFSYMVSLIVWTLLLLAFPVSASLHADVPDFSLALIALLVAFPSSDLVVGLLNKIVVASLPPRHLPRLELSNDIPPELSTFVVVPTMFHGRSGIKRQIEQLEVHYLSNQCGNVYYALLSDWVDADRETQRDDEELLREAYAGIDALNAKYGQTLFFVFHRKRLWNPSEGKWMGWERKRGKIHEFNRLLRSASDTSFLTRDEKTAPVPSGICYVITLDADTLLTIDSVKKLVGVAAHPLNQPVLDPRTRYVVRGYGIFQPRMTPTLPRRQERSIFHTFFAGASGTDAYSSSVSELYQDLFGQGTYTGKGLYHVDTFEAALARRIPENALLSHDLFEGVFARCALVSDIEFFDEFPSHFEVASSREHRWTRGDWQLLPWILGLHAGEIPAIGRWKMIDNLRRSLSAPGAFFTLLASWAVPGAPQGILMAYALAAVGLSALLALTHGVAAPRRGITWRTHVQSVLENIGLGLGNSLITLILLPQQAQLKIDAIIVSIIRVFITRRQLLNWVTAMQAKAAADYTTRYIIRPMGVSSLVVAGIGALIMMFNPGALHVALPFLALWWIAPVIALLLSLPPKLDKAEILDAHDKKQLRLYGRRIWRFFTTFVTAEDHYLPPDNFQEDPHPVIAHRSSPTNFGLYLLSVAAARDFGWLGIVECLGRMEATLDTLESLPRLKGHFYNWYDTRDLRMLEPGYISTVDSGNLAGHLLTLAEFCRELLNSPLNLATALSGLEDSHYFLSAAVEGITDNRRTQIVTLKELRETVAHYGKLLNSAPVDAEQWSLLWKQLKSRADSLLDLARAYSTERGDEGETELTAWATLLRNDVQSHVNDINNLMPWLHFSGGLETPVDSQNQPVFWQGLSVKTRLRELPGCYRRVLEELDISAPASPVNKDAKALRMALGRGVEQVETLTARLETLAAKLENRVMEMDFRFLYDNNCNLFSLGYRVNDSALDASYYDLLASEARLASLLAIAKQDVPSRHWFHLGRRVIRAARGTVLLSWSGSMFEYLMPSLVTYTPRYSLLDQTCRLVIKRQIHYGKERHVPWGISESAFNVRDSSFTYQYSPFGVPGLGMKRWLQDDLVVAPYASALAAMYLPREAIKNLARLETEGALGRYGFYEALDYTPVRLAEGQRVAIVRCYMAHHQGMSLVAFANAVHDGRMRHRFHLTPIIKAVNLLLQERIPQGSDSDTTQLLEESFTEDKTLQLPPIRSLPFATSPTPSAHILSNGDYAVMVTASGSGYSLWKNHRITRWREDTTRDPWGSYLYLRDVHGGQVWSAGYQPTVVRPDHYNVVFCEDRVRISRVDGTIASTLEIIVSPEDNAEIRRLSLTNNGPAAREIEITSYAEIVLAPQQADIAHPAFSNLFVQTEYLLQSRALLARRRQRSPGDAAPWAMHMVNGSQAINYLQYETDRARFIGRGLTLREPVAVMDGRPLTNTVGDVLDPIFSLRTRVVLKEGATEHITFTTLAASSRGDIEAASEKYRNPGIYERVSGLAWTHSQVQLHHLRIKTDEAQLFQDLGNRLVYSDPSLRPVSKVMEMNTLNVGSLWRHGISGDLPILLLRVNEVRDRFMVEQLLRAHEYWRIKKLAVDLVIINEKELSYIDDMDVLLKGLVRESQALNAHAYHEYESYGSIFVLRKDQLSEDEQGLFQYAARVVLRGNRGTLSEQLLRQPRARAAYVVSRPSLPRRTGSPALPVPRLEYFNGLGGFADEGREYVIILDNNQSTPVPWVNVVANSEFGFMVSESGGGFTWCGNSRENQLTPWSNDPVMDAPGEVFYLRDNETNECWCPTALPIRVNNAGYVICHGQGYSRFRHASHDIESELLQFVSPDDPVKIASLVLKNTAKRSRRLTITAYVEWVLGASRSVTAAHVVTELNKETGAIFAYNAWDSEFGSRIAFADLCGLQSQWTADRTEFIGRNGSLDAPAGLLASATLKHRAGAGLDPCAALQTVVEIEANGQTEIVFLLGQGDDRDHAVDLIRKYRAQPVEATFKNVLDLWDGILGKVQVKTPDRELDILLNRWLLYQSLACRMWARAAFYQAGGAYGFRDQLQDSMALAMTRPDLVREHILRAAGRQFAKGDVQHWWHPPTGRGVRTHFSDDRAWLPYVVCHYLRVTGDSGLLEENLPFLEGMDILPEHEDAYFQPTLSARTVTVYEHCALALDLSLTEGAHGLPLMGSGDWNDGMNRVGIEGKGESVWLAWFLIATLTEFARVAEDRGDSGHALRWREYVERLKVAVETAGWDGAWYKRAFFDDGSPLGSAVDSECRIDAIAQSWSVISGAGDPEHSRRAMNSVREYLVRHGDDLVLLFTPPFDKTEKDPGYIRSYPPGVRENGGQYTHAAVWSVIAFALLGEGDRAMELLRMLNPINRSAGRTGVHAYKVEPYVMSADIYAEPPHSRRGGWTWYTGAAGWYYRAGLEWIIGLRVDAGKLIINPCIPRDWKSYSVVYRHGGSRYEITVDNPAGVQQGVVSIELDGELLPKGEAVALRDDGKVHDVRVVLG